ncbi:MAG: LapA family protein [Candidatus Nealsonbacteria bacterium]|nr:LapA family protein [Candidatus Nealsonbacteria bacterium]
MLLFPIIVALIIAILAVILAFQNTAIILVTFLIWKFEGSLALVLLLAFIMGVIASLLILLPRIIKKGLVASNQKKKIKELEIKLEEKKEESNKENYFNQPIV